MILLILSEVAKEQAKQKSISDNQFGKSLFQKLVKKIDDVKSSTSKITGNVPSHDLLGINMPQPTPNQRSNQGQLNPFNFQEVPTTYNNFPQNKQTISTTGIPQVSQSNLMDLPNFIDFDYPEELFELPEVKRELFSSFYANNPYCIFIQGDAYLNAKEDKKQLLQKVNDDV